MAKVVKTQAEKELEKERTAKRKAEYEEQKRKSFITKHSGFNIREKSKEDAALYECILKDIIEYRAQLKDEAARKEFEKRRKAGVATFDEQPIPLKSRNPTIAAVVEAAQLFDVVKSNPDFKPSYLPSLSALK